MVSFRHLLAISYLFLSLYGAAHSQSCLNKFRCSDCLTASAECGWCEKKDFVLQSRCDVNFGDQCVENDVVNPSKETTITKDEEFGQLVQIKPQKFTVDLRIDDSQTFNVTVRRAPNYPVDLYYLMDVSNSMADDLETLKDLAPRLIETVGNLTTNFRMGFGKFVDKETLPYVDTYGERLNDPCGDGCEAAFAFINSLPLNNDANVFQTEIQREATSGNLDLPEGLLDALMQTAVCQKAIKWEKNALHLVVIATDAQFHTAGDGKLAGIYTPNDGLCHLNHNEAGGRYMNATYQDYPSVSHIRQVLFENKIIPMFAAAGGQVSLYKALSDALRPVTSFAERLDKDSSNILGLIKRGYEAIAGRVTMTAVDESGGKLDVKVKVVECRGVNATELDDDISQQGCKDIKEGETAVFEVSVKLAECASDTFTIYLDAGAFGQTDVTINPLCSCECQEPLQVNSSSCSGNGNLECGVCICNHPWAGLTCDERCDPDSTSIISLCKPNNATVTDPVCSGHGQCVCGCDCDTNDDGRPLWSGIYCQCPQLGCSRDSQGKECGGPDKGQCVCSGPDCACECHCTAAVRSTNNPTCECEDESRCERNGLICSNLGTCECDGNCDCQVGYYGQYCEECLVCQICTDNNVSRCIACQKAGSGCDDIYCPFNITILDSRPPADHRIVYQNQSYDTEPCNTKDADDCINTFYITNQVVVDGLQLVEALDNSFRDCPGSVNVVPIVVGIVAGIFAVGLFILFAWWILMQIAAYREYKAFVKEQANASWNQTTSPLYEPPSQKYMNPTYKGKGQKA